MLLIYTPRVTSRLKFVFKQICTRILGFPIGFTDSTETFITHDGQKMSYGTQPLGSEFFVKSHGLLFDQGISDLDIYVQDWKGTKCFFSANYSCSHDSAESRKPIEGILKKRMKLQI